MNTVRYFCVFAVALGIFFLSPILVTGQTTVHAAVVINELFPKTEDTTREFIELYNTGDTLVSLNQWKLSNTTGTVKSFIIGASPTINPHGYVTFYQPQTGITFAINGDSVILTDDHGTVVDSQSFLGTLGFNTPMGRSPDGTGVWVICNTITPNLPNDCPSATPTPTPAPTPTPIPTNTPLPIATEIPTPAATQPLQGIPIYQPPTTSVLGETTAPTPSPTPSTDNFVIIRVPNAIDISKSLAVQIAVVAGAWILLALIAMLRRKRKPRR